MFLLPPSLFPSSLAAFIHKVSLSLSLSLYSLHSAFLFLPSPVLSISSRLSCLFVLVLRLVFSLVSFSFVFHLCIFHYAISLWSRCSSSQFHEFHSLHCSSIFDKPIFTSIFIRRRETELSFYDNSNGTSKISNNAAYYYDYRVCFGSTIIPLPSSLSFIALAFQLHSRIS